MSADVTLLSHEGKNGLEDAHTKEPKEGVTRRMSKLGSDLLLCNFTLLLVAPRPLSLISHFTKASLDQIQPMWFTVKRASETSSCSNMKVPFSWLGDKKKKTAADTSSTWTYLATRFHGAEPNKRQGIELHWGPFFRMLWGWNVAKTGKNNQW